MNDAMTKYDLTGKKYLVTGGGAGIGLAIVEAVAEKGATVIAVDLSSGVHEIATAMRGNGFDVHSECADLTKVSEIENLYSRVHSRFGSMHGLINNAGITIRSDFLKTTLDEFQSQVDLNLRATFLCSQLTAREMIASKIHGAIINIASNHAGASVQGFEAYAGTKGGVVSMTRAMAWSLGSYGIRVNSVSPGLTRTAAIAESMLVDSSLATAYPSLHATNRINEPRDIGEIVSFLLSDCSRSLTGADLIADNGMSARLFNRQYI